MRTQLPIFGLIACISVSVYAQPRLATESEIDLLREALAVDDIPEWNHYRVLEVQAAFTQESDGRPARLDGWVYFEPYEVQGALCMMEARFVTGLRSGDSYDWSLERFAYWNWQAGATDSCRISDRSQLPDSAVQSGEPIPSATLVYVLANSDRLLALAYEHAEASLEEDDSARDRIVGYAANGRYQLERIEVTQHSSPAYGFAYSATFRASGVLEGPVVIFSVTASGFVVHSVGTWIA